MTAAAIKKPGLHAHGCIMAPVVVVVPKTKTEISERQSLVQSQELISVSMSCVALLRGLFPEPCFHAEAKYGLQLKQLRPGRSAKSDRFLRYIQHGCFDALHRKYLKSITLSILQRRNDPKSTLETFTWSISYPTDHLVSEMMSQMSIVIDRSERPLTTINTVDRFRESSCSLIRQLCGSCRALPVLPKKKFLKMVLTYYEDVTPKEYEPPGFIPSVFDLVCLFHGDAAVEGYGSVSSSFHSYTHPSCPLIHRIGVSMKRLKSAELAMAAPQGEELPTQASADTPSASQGTGKRLVTGAAPGKGEDATKCGCGCNVTDLDMIQCECCSTWQHTVCAGFYSNRDHRIQSVNYICLDCRFAADKPVLKVVKELSAYRRALSVVFNEGISDTKPLASRLGFSIRATSRHVSRMVEDGFVVKQPAVVVMRTKQVRERLRQYFNHDLVKFPVFADTCNLTASMTQPRVVKPVGKSNAVADHQRCSVNDLTLSVDDKME